MAKKKEIIIDTMDVLKIEMGEVYFHIVGTTPMIMNRLPAKAAQQLLLPPKRRNRAELESSLKHDPVGEFRNAVCLNRDTKTPALFHLPDGAFRKAIAQAALDIPGAKKAEVGRLISIPATQIDLYGVPYMFTRIVRMGGMTKTPDVRTRAIFPQWACRLPVRFVKTKLNQGTIANLLMAAGIIVGIGDYRNEKGAGSYGCFKVVNDNDAEFEAIIKKQARAAQVKAMNSPMPYDDETDELISWFNSEADRRELKVPSRDWSDPRVVS